MKIFQPLNWMFITLVEHINGSLIKFFHDATERNAKLDILHPACLDAKAMYIIDPTLTRNCCQCPYY